MYFRTNNFQVYCIKRTLYLIWQRIVNTVKKNKEKGYIKQGLSVNNICNILSVFSNRHTVCLCQIWDIICVWQCISALYYLSFNNSLCKLRIYFCQAFHMNTNTCIEKRDMKVKNVMWAEITFKPDMKRGECHVKVYNC